MTATLVTHDRALLGFASEVGADDPVAVRGGGTRWTTGGPLSSGARIVAAPTGIIEYSPEEMTVRVRAGTPVAELDVVLAGRGQRTALADRGGRVGGGVVVGENHLEVLGRGTLRASVLQVRYVSAEGLVVNGGGPTVKNVTGFDLPRLIVGSLGTLGLLAEVTLRTNPVPPARIWLAADDADPFAVREALQRPSAVLWDGRRTWVLLEGHAADVAAERLVLARMARFDEVEGPPPLPPHRWSLAPAELRSIDLADFVAVVGVGLAYSTAAAPAPTISPAVRTLHARLKTNFDPTGRLNPGRDPLGR